MKSTKPWDYLYYFGYLMILSYREVIVWLFDRVGARNLITQSLVCGIGCTRPVKTSRHTESTPNYIKTWPHEGEKLWNFKVLFDFSSIFLGFHWNFFYFGRIIVMWDAGEIVSRSTDFFTQSIMYRMQPGIPRDLGDAVRHPEVSAGCLEVFTKLVEPETRIQ